MGTFDGDLKNGLMPVAPSDGADVECLTLNLPVYAAGERAAVRHKPGTGSEDRVYILIDLEEYNSYRPFFRPRCPYLDR